MTERASIRLLDLGGHDAYVAVWAIRRLREDDIQVHVDGVELNPDAVAIANRRLAEEGATGKYVVAAAEDVADHFDAGTYDAVAAYELIEHVPSMDALLTAAESMLTPDGLVYVSTPDGTFGEGQNPHHLRALRAVDLADILRRRGELVDFDVGADTVTVASYRPGPRKEDIAIFCGPGWMPWVPMDIATKGLGGSETAAVRLADSLSSMGYVVTVYGEVPTGQPAAFRSTIFKHWSAFDPLDRRAMVIASRLPYVFDRPVSAHTTVLWLHDVDAGDELTPVRADRIDEIVTLSKWHQRHVQERYPFLNPTKVGRARNGIHLPYFTPKPLGERKQRLIYTSSPDRGLDVLLELWPRIREQAPDAELAYCYPDVYDAVAAQNLVVAAHRERIAKLADQPGVIQLGSLSQPKLAALMCESRVWAHPSWSSGPEGAESGVPFHETSCIGAMEAQAAGCLVVASDWGALSETVKWGRLVNSDAPGQRWQDGFVKHIVEGLTDDTVMQAAIDKGPPRVADRSWDGVAKHFVSLLGAPVLA